MGLGRHLYTLSLTELQDILKASSLISVALLSPLTFSQAIYIGTSTFPLSATFIKFALLLQYLRVFTGRRNRLLCKVMLVITGLVGAAFGLCSWLSCFPVSAFWDIFMQGGRCWGFASRDQLEFMRIMVTQVVITATLDLIVFLLPAWLYFQPDTPQTTRLSLLGLFVLGFSYVNGPPPSPLRITY